LSPLQDGLLLACHHQRYPQSQHLLIVKFILSELDDDMIFRFLEARISGTAHSLSSGKCAFILGLYTGKWKWFEDESEINGS